ncbi:tail fiber protein [Escherichia phage ECML-4]|uniref:Tail spike TSP1/Gp66 N-terminal domain-containing protein n=5 Tax=Kuttervirus TaxID=2169536 RepID=I6ZXK8_9CAUD|nr:tail fiber protein [Escherichia phage ECML-4]YP_009879581.1 tail fiber protein [Escherichia phage FEC14]AGF88656.1 tail spike protein [Salmonella phage FSL SP-063]AGF89170.1 tail spike protein [Salmonella phage FSL SP-029]QFR58264.1 tailspike protein II [Escherichia phage vB_EcoM_3HA11]QPX74342.1 putative exo-alpha-sialidase [Salmonella phage FrontPhageNews]QPX74543.1 putative exo-alpha-sialidase [Salmonella phage Sajous1]QQO88797.1 hypothetical protein JHLACNCA_00062 [Salmonella phage vB
MNPQFAQPKGSTSKESNKDSIARKFGCKKSEVVYAKSGQSLSGYKVIYDKETQRAYSLPVDIPAGTTAISLSASALLVHSGGSVDLGELASQRNEYNVLPGSFTTGAIVSTKNDVLTHNGIQYRWNGSLPKVVPQNSLPSSDDNWIGLGASYLKEQLNSTSGASMVVLANGKTIEEEFAEEAAWQNQENMVRTVIPNVYHHIRGVQRHSGKNLAWSAPDVAIDKLNPTDTVFYRMPQIVKTGDGTLMIFCNELHGNNTDIGATPDQQCNIVMKYSIDNGWSWSAKVVVANFGATYQNGEIAAVYNPVDGRVYCYFTSCKGQLGWGYSQPGNDPNTSSQIYVTYCDAEAPTIWRTPANITATLKPATADFIWTSPTKPVVLPDGKMAMIVSTVTGSRVDSFLTIMKYDIKYSMDYVLSSEESGGEVGLNLLPDGRMVMNSRAYHTTDLKGLQKFYISDHQFKNWQHLSDLVTSDSKGDLVPIFDGVNGVLTWAFTCANGVGDNSIGRTNYRVWISRDLVTWGLAPTGDINTSDSVGYIASMPGGDDGYVISTSESGGFGGIWFTQWNAKYIQNRNYNRYHKELRELESVDETAMLASGAIPNYSFYVNKDSNLINFNRNGTPVKIQQLGVSQNAVDKYTTTQTLASIPVDGVDIVLVTGSGITLTLSGFSGGYMGQRVTVISDSSGGGVVLKRADTTLPTVTDRFHFNVAGAFTALRVDYATKMMVTLVKTPSGWFTESIANVTI